MVSTPNYGPSEYLDATTFNAMAAAVYAGIQQVSDSTMSPGLILPEGISISTSGLQATLTFPTNFGVVFGNGTVAAALGNTSGSINATYAVSFAPLIPGSGSTTAYLLCSVAAVSESPLTVVGPPPGHPDWNPGFVPYTLYSVTQDSITVTASTTAPDNSTTFSLGSVVLSAGMSTLPPFNQNLVYRAGALSPSPVVLNSGTRTLSTRTQGIIQNINSTALFTLPPVAGLNGSEYMYTAATTGTVTIQAQGSDVIWGMSGTTSTQSIALPTGSSVKLVAQNGAWYVVSASPNLEITGGNTSGGGGTTTTFATFYTFNVNNPPTTDIDMNINDTLYIPFTNVTSVPVFVATGGGTFRVIMVISKTSQSNNDLIWRPNNQIYPGNSTIGANGNFTLWVTENSDGPDPWDTSFTFPDYPFLARTPQTGVYTSDGITGQPLGYFVCDAFADGNRFVKPDTVNDLGQCIYDVLFCTRTEGKMLKYEGGVSGGAGAGVCIWYDQSTAWTSLGTFGLGASLSVTQPATITGFAYITKIGGVF